jgi:hypothetical protein
MECVCVDAVSGEGSDEDYLCASCGLTECNCVDQEPYQEPMDLSNREDNSDDDNRDDTRESPQTVCEVIKQTTADANGSLDDKSG